MSFILGISAFYHDSSATLIKGEKIIAAAQEERFSRIKHDNRFPKNAISYCLEEEKISLDEVDAIIFYEKPFLKFERLLETYLAFVPRGFLSFSKAMPLWIKEKLFQKKVLFDECKKIDKNFNNINKIKFCSHHRSHAASAFFASPFENSLILTIDGVGEWSTTTIALGNKNKIKILEEINFPHSLGLLYSAFTYYLGFKVNSGEYKVMGLAPYGQPKYTELILKELITLKEDGSYKLNMKYFNFATGLTMINKNFENLFGVKKRNSNKEGDNLTQFHMDMASSIQNVIEIVILKICRYIRDKYKISNLCLAGGVALNCVANGKILKENFFDNIWIQPASGDAGGSLGAALSYIYDELSIERHIFKPDMMNGSYLGPKFKNEEIKKQLEDLGANYQEKTEEDILKIISKELSNEKIIGWFQGRMEFGPRSLGCRSIIADPRSEKMQQKLNLKIKFRESFRPFAPSILIEELKNYFDMETPSPYMLLVANIKDNLKIQMTESQEELFGIKKLNIRRSTIPSVTHVDYSARVQTVEKDSNSRYYRLIKNFFEITGCPILINTSFNIRGEPIVCEPKDAFNCFMGTNLDILVIENFILYKDSQSQKLIENYKEKYALD
jgi:carbamoyltransferase